MIKLFDAHLFLYTRSLEETDKVDLSAMNEQRVPPLYDHPREVPASLKVLGVELERHPITGDYSGQRGDLVIQVYRHGTYKLRRTLYAAERPGWHLRLRRGGTEIYRDSGWSPRDLCLELDRRLRQRADRLRRTPTKG